MGERLVEKTTEKAIKRHAKAPTINALLNVAYDTKLLGYGLELGMGQTC